MIAVRLLRRCLSAHAAASQTEPSSVAAIFGKPPLEPFDFGTGPHQRSAAHDSLEDGGDSGICSSACARRFTYGMSCSGTILALVKFRHGLHHVGELLRGEMLVGGKAGKALLG